MKTESEIRDWMVTRVAKLASLDAAEIDPAAPFQSFGVSSVRLVRMSGDLEDWLGRDVDPSVFWEHPTIDALSAHLAGGG